VIRSVKRRRHLEGLLAAGNGAEAVTRVPQLM
jgi:hypothetical protein